MAPSLFEKEILEQPEVLARQLTRGRAAAEAVASAIRGRDPRFVLIAARGSSDNAARYAQYVLGARNRLAVALAAPSLFTIYGAPPRLEGALVVGVSQSGRSPDIVSVLEEGRAQGALTLALTNEPGSPLALAAEHVLDLGAGEERAVAASKTYAAELLAFAMLSASLEGSAEAFAELDALPEKVARTLGARDAARSAAARGRGAARFVVLGRGYNYATVFEIALKIKETSYVLADPYSPADFLHGPAALLEPGLPVLVVAPSGKVEGVSSLLDLLEARRAEAIVISDAEEALARAKVALTLPSGVPEWLSPLVAVVPGQLFSLALAEAKGLDPDRPRGLSKVTETR